jgi:predicted ATPase
MIKEITISNFRGIEELKIPLTAINIFIGVNGTGKSSILEAIALAASSPSYVDCVGVNVLERIATRRGRPYYANLQHLIKIGADNATVTIVKDDSTTNTIEIYNKDTIDNKKKEYRDEYKLDELDSKAQTYISSIQAANFLSTLMSILSQITQQRMISQQPQLSILREEGITYILNTNQKHAARLSIYDNKVIMIPQIIQSQSKSGLILVDDLLRFYEDFYKYINKLILIDPKTYKNIMEFLRHREIEDFKDIEGNIFIKRQEDEYYVPINMVGDGTKMLLLDALVFNLPNADIILLEEPENYMHPEYLLKIVRFIIRESRDNRKQFFITTHNLDLIKYMIENIEGSGMEKDMQIIILYRDENGRISYELYSYEKASEDKEASVDIRFL